MAKEESERPELPDEKMSEHPQAEAVAAALAAEPLPAIGPETVVASSGANPSDGDESPAPRRK